jgi:uncharacterized protein YecE (DUF72 family)
VPVFVGTSGWQYRDWRGVLYPADVPQRRWLEHYAGHFATVENNNTFYRLPPRETFTHWHDRTPGDFVMAVKASRYLTHVRRLRDPAEPVARLLGAAAGLGDRLGPVLLQLPPNLAADPQRLDACLREFGLSSNRSGGPGGLGPSGGSGGSVIPGLRTPVRVAVEPRHKSWWSGEVRQVLTQHNAALVWTDRLGHPLTPLWNTAGWGYLRFHEGASNPWPRYGQRALRSWAERIAQTWSEGADVYAYFNNDQGGAAVQDAAMFAAIVSRAGREVTRATIPSDRG